MNIPVCRVRTLSKTVIDLKNYGLKVVGASEKAQVLHHQSDISGPLGIVMGSEDTGISNEVLVKCDELIRIPQHGKIDSLNVSSAAAVLLFEADRQRHQAD